MAFVSLMLAATASLGAASEELNTADSVVIIGTDCPELDSALVQQAFVYLHSHEVVIGPASDGGYYLIGMRAHFPMLFADMPWSTSTVFEETLLRCRQSDLAVAVLSVLSDVDEWKDIQNVVHRQWLIS